MTSTEHVCDPTGDPCPPWMHPYPSTDEILYRQNRAAAERAAAQQPAKPHAPVMQPSYAERAADGLLRQLEILVRRGYRITEEQEQRLIRLRWSVCLILPESAWQDPPVPCP